MGISKDENIIQKIAMQVLCPGYVFCIITLAHHRVGLGTLRNTIFMHQVFISHHHANDQDYKDQLLRINALYKIFIDGSVDTGDISDSLTDQQIRQKIRDEYLKNSTVTMLLVGTETKGRKHVDWETYSSMIDGKINKRSGVLVITLPSTGCTYFTAAHSNEKEMIYPEVSSWISIDTQAEYQRRYPYLPDRIIDNLIAPTAKISVTNWDRIKNNPEALRFLIHSAFGDRASCEYDLHRPMRRANA